MATFWTVAFLVCVFAHLAFTVDEHELRDFGRFSSWAEGLAWVLSLMGVLMAAKALSLIPEWCDPFTAEQVEQGRQIAARRRGGGLFLLAFRFFPYAGVLLGGFFTFLYCRLATGIRAQRKRSQ